MFRYELHCHTSEVSKCSYISAIELIRAYKTLGYSGIVITDHFFNGNTTVSKDLPWHERVDMFKQGYENALEEGKKLNIQVFFAWEYSFWGTDFLTYGLDVNWLYNNPDCLEWSIPDYFKHVHDAGGVVVQAHPYRKASYIELIRLEPWDTDGVEVLNSTIPEEENIIANYYSKHYNLFKTVGSDNHQGIKKYLTAVEFGVKQNSLMEIMNNLKAGNGMLKHYEVEEISNDEYVLHSIEHDWLK